MLFVKTNKLVQVSQIVPSSTSDIKIYEWLATIYQTRQHQPKSVSMLSKALEVVLSQKTYDSMSHQNNSTWP